MQQKVALTTAFFPTRGTIADMGSGSGRGTFDLACLYPELELIGVDINPRSVELARAKFQRENLRYEVGDIAEPVFAPQSLDGVLDSSVLHHVTSFNEFSLRRIEECLSNQAAALRPGGVLIVRDFVVPDGPDQVLLDLPEQDGSAQGSLPELSSSALFERFAATFRSSLHLEGGVPFERQADPRPGTARYKLALRDANEFILRKDYRQDWETELLEEYTYYSQSDFEHAFERLGLRLLASVPIYNPWIIEHRYRGKLALFSPDGRRLAYPPTNYFVVGEKLGEQQPVTLEVGDVREPSAPRFFVPRTYRNLQSGELIALAERPGRTLDVVPWFVRGGRVHVLAKKGFPRPLLALGAAESEPRMLGRGRVSGYITEPLSAIVDPDEALLPAVARILRERAGIEQPFTPSEQTRYFTSPGALDEIVEGTLVRIDPPDTAPRAVAYGDLGDAGSVRALDAAQLLRAAQVGGTFDARLEIHAYRALACHGQPLDAWLGAEPVLPLQAAGEGGQRPAIPALAFELAPHGSRYLQVMEASCVARGAGGRELARATREYVVPRVASRYTVSVLPAQRSAAGVLVAVETRALPAVQRFTGSAALEVCPAFRLPEGVRELPAIEQYVRTAIRAHGATVGALVPLGGPYAPSAGATPELVFPFVAELTSLHESDLSLVPLASLIDGSSLPLDGHLRIAALRLAHALGVG